jgi:hypothetical protein
MRSRDGATVSPQASMTELYELSSRAVDIGKPTVDQYTPGCLARA